MYTNTSFLSIFGVGSFENKDAFVDVSTTASILN